MLASAWLRDTLPDGAVANILEPQTASVREEVRTWQPGLDDEQRQMIAWWSRQLAIDPELDEIFRAITRKAGFSAPATSSAASPPASATSALDRATAEMIAKLAAETARQESAPRHRHGQRHAQSVED